MLVMERALGQIAFGLAVIAALSFGVLLLDGGEANDWWERVPASIFYTTIFLFVPVLGLVAIVSFVASAFRKRPRR